MEKLAEGTLGVVGGFSFLPICQQGATFRTKHSLLSLTFPSVCSKLCLAVSGPFLFFSFFEDAIYSFDSQ